jgi:hypothetical protein
MRLELLRTIPISGSIREQQFMASAGANAWVKFTNDDGVEWVGVFGSGESSRFYTAIPFADDRGRSALIVAGGQGYVVDTASAQLLRRTPWQYSKAAIGVPERECVLVADDTTMWAVSRHDDRPIWKREPAWYDFGETDQLNRVALDGIVFDVATSHDVRGKVWQGDGWYAFRVHMPTLEFVTESFVTSEWELIASSPPVV